MKIRKFKVYNSHDSRHVVVIMIKLIIITITAILVIIIKVNKSVSQIITCLLKWVVIKTIITETRTKIMTIMIKMIIVINKLLLI